MEPRELDLPDVGDDLDLDPARLPHELKQLTQKILVPDTPQAQDGADFVILADSLGALDPEDLRRALAFTLARADTLLVVAHP